MVWVARSRRGSFGVADRVDQGGPDGVPDGGQAGAHVGVAEHPALERLEAFHHLGVVLQVVGQLDQQPVDRLAGRMPRIIPYAASQVERLAVDPVDDDRVDPAG